MNRNALLISIFGLFGALGCGGRENGTNRGTGTASTPGASGNGPGMGVSNGANAPGPDDAGPVGANNCFPSAASCDGPPPQLSPLDTIHGCLGAPITLPEVCSTSANRCNENSGLALDCAFAPDGGLFVGLTSDNYVLTGNGWTFVQPPNPFQGPIRTDQVATAAQNGECTAAMCSPPCPGVEALLTFASCSEDGGTAGQNGDAGASPTPPVNEPPSCQRGGPGMTTCGPGGSGNESCCTSPGVPAGTFYRNYDGVTYTEMNGKATLSPVRVDKYEITVGRFRQFVSAAAQGWLPSSGSGKHAHLNGGRGLVNSAGSSYESGWDSSWSTNLATTVAGWNANLSCNGLATWTSSPGANENQPINCVDWYDVYAFCIWDGGFLPSDAEWNYAASGGSEQRVYPWSVPPKLVNIDCTYANYGGGTIGLADRCSPRGTNNVGSESPKGDGKWGHSDLGGNVWEWVLDYGTGGPCIDCAYTSPPPPEPPPAPPDVNVVRTSRGGGLGAGFSLEASSTSPGPPTDRNIEQGARCARVP